jgi:AraC-like DNA-binding protein
VVQKLRDGGLLNISKLKAAYLAAPVMTPTRYQAIIELLSHFAEQLEDASNRIVIQRVNNEPLIISRAKEYIHEHQAEELSLGQVAKAVNASASYLCRLFKRTTGINYNQYRSRMRLEDAKQLLMNPNLRVGEIAYNVGFQSLTHFNRVFKKFIGQSPTEYRAEHRI